MRKVEESRIPIGRLIVVLIHLSTLFAFLFACSSASVAEDVYSTRGSSGSLVVVRDLFPFSAFLPQVVQFEKTTDVGDSSFSLSSGWSNTINGKSNEFLFDLETRLLEPKFSFRYDTHRMLSVSIPWFWRGGGVLDESIYQWHEFWGLPQGPRSGTGGRDDRFLIKAKNSEGEFIELRNQGFALGDVQLGASQVFPDAFKNTDTTVGIGLSLPTSRDEYGLDAPAFSLSLSSNTRLPVGAVHLIGQYSYLLDPWIAEYKMQRNILTLIAGYSLTFDLYTLQFIGTYTSNVLSNIPAFPEYQTYLDIVVERAFSQAIKTQFVFRENPAPETGTADVSAYLNFVYTH